MIDICIYYDKTQTYSSSPLSKIFFDLTGLNSDEIRTKEIEKQHLTNEEEVVEEIRQIKPQGKASRQKSSADQEKNFDFQDG